MAGRWPSVPGRHCGPRRHCGLLVLAFFPTISLICYLLPISTNNTKFSPKSHIKQSPPSWSLNPLSAVTHVYTHTHTHAHAHKINTQKTLFIDIKLKWKILSHLIEFRSVTCILTPWKLPSQITGFLCYNTKVGRDCSEEILSEEFKILNEPFQNSKLNTRRKGKNVFF